MRDLLTREETSEELVETGSFLGMILVDFLSAAKPLTRFELQEEREDLGGWFWSANFEGLVRCSA